LQVLTVQPKMTAVSAIEFVAVALVMPRLANRSKRSKPTPLPVVQTAPHGSRYMSALHDFMTWVRENWTEPTNETAATVPADLPNHAGSGNGVSLPGNGQRMMAGPAKPSGSGSVGGLDDTAPQAKPMKGTAADSQPALKPRQQLSDKELAEIAEENRQFQKRFPNGYKPPRTPPHPGDGEEVTVDEAFEELGKKTGVVLMSGGHAYHRKVWKE
jgi:hypothetical protein